VCGVPFTCIMEGARRAKEPSPRAQTNRVEAPWETDGGQEGRWDRRPVTPRSRDKKGGWHVAMEGKLEGRRGEGRVMRSLEARMRRPSFGINRPVVSVEGGGGEDGGFPRNKSLREGGRGLVTQTR